MTRYRWGITGACILFLVGVIVYNLREFLAYDYLVYYAGGKSVNWFLDYPSSLYDLDILRETVRAENFRYIFGDSGLWLAFTYPPVCLAPLYSRIVLAPSGGNRSSSGIFRAHCLLLRQDSA